MEGEMIDLHHCYDFLTHHNTIVWQDDYRFWIWGDDGKAHAIDRCWALAGMWRYLETIYND
jgi:hypothetical protein